MSGVLIGIGQQVMAALQLLKGDATLLCQPVQHLIRLLTFCVYFRAITGRKYRHFLERGSLGQPMQCLHHLFRGKGHLLPDVERGGSVVDAQSKNGHENSAWK